MQFRLKISKLIFIKFNNIPIACIPNIIRYVVSFFLIIFNSKMYTKSTKATTVNTIFPIIATIPFFVAYLPNSVLYFSYIGILYMKLFSGSWDLDMFSLLCLVSLQLLFPFVLIVYIPQRNVLFHLIYVVVFLLYRYKHLGMDPF